MAKAYSLDLKGKVIAYVKSRKKAKAVEIFNLRRRAIYR
jgi:hypothetical protein